MFRAIKLYKYLDKSRFEVDFITHGAAGRFKNAVRDDSLLAEVDPQPTVYRVRTFILHDYLPSLGARLRRGRKRPARPAPPAQAPATPPAAAPRQGRRSLAGRVYGWFALSVYVPDYLFLWGWCAAVVAVWQHLRRRYDLIYTTSSPESAHLPGLALSALGVPWVVDYRYGGPLWIKEIVGVRKPPLRDRLDMWFQRRVLTMADQVITQSERIRADFCGVFGLDPARVHVVPSGFDETDFDAARPDAPPFPKRRGEIHLLHLGALEGAAERERGQMVAALEAIHGRLLDHGRRLVVHTVGHDVLRGAGAHGGDLRHHHHGVVVHHEVPAYVSAADCYLLSTWTTANDDVQGFTPSKLWEYLRGGAPILTTGVNDEVWSIVEEAGVGLRLVLNGDGQRSHAQLADELVDRVDRRSGPSAAVARYSWRARAQAVQQVFDLIVDAPLRQPGETLA